jgi:hypothetical protein
MPVTIRTARWPRWPSEKHATPEQSTQLIRDLLGRQETLSQDQLRHG